MTRGPCLCFSFSSHCFSFFPHPHHHHYLKILLIPVQHIQHKIYHFNHPYMYNPSGNTFTCAINTTIHVHNLFTVPDTLSPANSSSYFSRTQPQATSRPLSLDLPTRGTSLSGTLQYLFFYVWIISCRGGAGAVSKVHPCNKHHSTFKAEGYSTAHVQSSLGDEPMSWWTRALVPGHPSGAKSMGA